MLLGQTDLSKRRSSLDDYLDTQLEMEIYNELTDYGTGTYLFEEPLAFFELLYEKLNFVVNNCKDPSFVLSHLFNLELTEKQKNYLIEKIVEKLIFTPVVNPPDELSRCIELLDFEVRKLYRNSPFQKTMNVQLNKAEDDSSCENDKGNSALFNDKSEKVEDNVLKEYQLNLDTLEKYAFINAKDFNLFRNILKKLASNEIFELPNEPIRLKARTMTKVARLLREFQIMYRGNYKTMDDDKEFLEFVRILQPFNDENDDSIIKKLGR